MRCKQNNICGKLCDHFVITTGVTFADGTLTITLPDNVTYSNRDIFCIVVGQTIPEATTINAPVVAVIGAGTTTFPLLTRCGLPVLSQQLSTRRKYKTIVSTTVDGGSFRVLCDLPFVDTSTLDTLNEA